MIYFTYCSVTRYGGIIYHGDIILNISIRLEGSFRVERVVFLVFFTS